MIRCLLIAAFLALQAIPAQSETMRLAVTTSFANSGLADILLPRIADDTGIRVEMLIVGTGQALRLGQAGDVDAVLVHARQAEEAFVNAGHATHRREIMYNDFVLVGPAVDPAGVGAAGTPGDALRAIALARASFVSRGDDSGTHKAERRLWDMAGVTPDGAWYKEVGSGMGAALNIASGLSAYILADRATWLKFKNKGDLSILFQGDPALFNQYAYLPVDPDRHPHIKAKLAHRLEDWLTSQTAQRLIDGYTLAGERLFTFNAKRP